MPWSLWHTLNHTVSTPTLPHTREVLCSEVPVHKVVEESADEIGAPVLIVEIVGVFPDVAGKEGYLSLDDRRHGIGCLDDLEVTLVGDQPRPAAAELPYGCLLKELLELLEALEIAVDSRG